MVQGLINHTSTQSTFYFLFSLLILLHHRTYLCNDKIGVKRDRVSLLDGLEGGGASPVPSALRTLLLWGCINRLPTIKPRREVGTSHPRLIPHMEVPKT